MRENKKGKNINIIYILSFFIVNMNYYLFLWFVFTTTLTSLFKSSFDR